MSDTDPRQHTFLIGVVSVLIIGCSALVLAGNNASAGTPFIVLGISHFLTWIIWRSFGQSLSRFVSSVKPIALDQSTETEDVTNREVKIRRTLENTALKYVQQGETKPKLFGVEQRINEIRSYLATEDNYWLVSLFGDGGIGKTSLTYECVWRHAANLGFQRVAWISVSSTLLAMQNLANHSLAQTVQVDTNLRWANYTKMIADQLDISVGYNNATWLNDLIKGIHNLPSGIKCLIIIDNLETPTDAGELVKEIGLRLIRPHKVIITTRVSIESFASNSVLELPLTGLDAQATYDFVRDLGQNNQEIINAPNTAFDTIFQVTEGNPYLINITMRRFLVSKLPLNVILEEIREASKGAGEQVRNYMFGKSIDLLTAGVGETNATNLLKGFCFNAAEVPLTYEDLFHASNITDETSFQNALELGCSLALIRVSGTLNRNYSIHSVLRAYTCKN